MCFEKDIESLSLWGKEGCSVRERKGRLKTCTGKDIQACESFGNRGYSVRKRKRTFHVWLWMTVELI